jgi:type I restriction enzyme R subunit
MIDIKIVSQNNNSTVVEEYKETTKKSITYQSEIELENEFIKLLQTQAYEYVRIRNNTDLVKNLRTQIEKLNNFKFNDEE